MSKYKKNPRFSNIFDEYVADENAETERERIQNLESDILEKGVLDPLKLWKNPSNDELEIIDGYTRYSIIQKHGINTFPIKVLHFETEDDAEFWIRLTQGARRNLSPRAIALNIGRAYNLRKKKVGAPEGNQNATKNNSATVAQLKIKEPIPPVAQEFSNAQIETFDLPKEKAMAVPPAEQRIEYDEAFKPKPLPVKQETETAKMVAKDFGVSPRSVKTYGKLAEIVEKKPELEKQFRQKEVSQKQILETPKPKPAPKLNEESTTDSFTETARRHGSILTTALKTLENQIVAARNEFHTKYGQDLFEHTQFLKQLGTVQFNNFLADTGLLKTLHICPKCKGKKCGRCKTGYLKQADYKDVVREMKI